MSKLQKNEQKHGTFSDLHRGICEIQYEIFGGCEEFALGVWEVAGMYSSISVVQ